ncbi:MAG: Fic/DOC family N-terminal domain-containing protein [Thermoleophilia bacterium]
MHDMAQPYNDLPDLPPAALVETPRVLKECIAAHRALGRMRAAAMSLPDQTILINAIPLLEAQASSQIENIVTTADALFRADVLERTDDPAVKEALRYRSALRRGVDAIEERPISTNLMIELCSIVTGVNTRIRATPGTTLRGDRTDEVVYTPPTGEDVLREKLAAWERFAHGASDLDPLVRIALLHYQFEAIHPFHDGNGRTGRILNLLLALRDDLLDTPILYLSGYILSTRGEYYRLLRAVTTDAAWEAWVLYLLEGIRLTAISTTARIETIRSLMVSTAERVRREAPASSSPLLLEVIFSKPYCRISDVVDAGIAKRQRASVHLKELVRIGILEEYAVSRDRIFLHRDLLDALGEPA